MSNNIDPIHADQIIKISLDNDNTEESEEWSDARSVLEPSVEKQQNTNAINVVDDKKDDSGSQRGKTVRPDSPTHFHKLKIVKSKNDTRKYKVKSLPNGLTALLISDLTGDEARLYGFDDYFADYCESEEETSTFDEDSSSDEDENAAKQSGGSVGGRRHAQSYDRSETKNRRDKKGSDDVSEALDGLSSAAALCVGVGSLHDPDDIPGLAHFLEHMVFMGSAKYPAEDGFDKYITKCGGHANAFTDCERTVFYFDVGRQNLRGALDRFAQFFIFPLMKKESVEREIQAVDSEFQSGMQSDSNRKQQLLSSMSREGHPMRKFMWGNAKTLKTIPEQNGINVYERLQKFREQMYSAPYMTLVVHSKDTLRTMEKWVVESFSNIPNARKPRPSLVSEREPFDPTSFHKLYKVVPVKDINQVEVTWSLPALLRYFYKEKPMYYITWLVVHGGSGGLLAYLKKKCWAFSIQCFGEHGSYEKNETGCLFTVAIAVTDKGLNHVYFVLTALFEYLEMLRLNGPVKRIFDEIQKIEDNEFRWQEITEPVDYVKGLSEDMHLYMPSHYLTGNSLMMEYNPRIISECLKTLKPNKANIMLVSKTFGDGRHCNEREKWYGTRYGVFDIDQTWRNKWENLEPNADFSYPERNTFISTNFKLVEGDDNYANILDPPTLVLESDCGRLWFKQDRFFEVPKGYIYFYFISPIVKTNALTIALFDMYSLLLGQIMSEDVFPADAANLEYSFDILDDGLIVKMNGFTHKLPRLFQTILDHIGHLEITESHFQIAKERLDRAYHNDCIRPDKLANDLHDGVMIKDYVLIITRRENLKMITKEMMDTFAMDFKNLLYVEGLVHGNFTEDKAVSFFTYVERKINNTLSREQIPRPLIIEFPQKDSYLLVRALNGNDPNTVITNFYQHGESTLRDSVLNELLENVLDEPCFGFLRTKEQLGYAVSVKHHDVRGIISLSLTVETQATKFTVTQVDAKIEEFLRMYAKTLDEMPEREFAEHVSSLITSKKCDDSNIGEECERYWGAIERRDYLFDKQDKEIAQLNDITLFEFRYWYRRLILGLERRKLGVQVMGADDSCLKKLTCCPFGFLSPKCRDPDLSLRTKYKLEYIASTDDHIRDLDEFKNNLKTFKKLTDEEPLIEPRRSSTKI